MPWNLHRHLLAMSADELEDLMKKWIARISRDGGQYLSFERPTASADMGRDAVGFLTKLSYGGEWHNYQCKQLNTTLSMREFTSELGKIFHYSCAGEFTLPSSYVFVCPNDAVRDVKKLVGLPATIADHLIDQWDMYCLKTISVNETPLTPEIRAAIEEYDFSRVELWKASELVEMPDIKAVMTETAGIDPGAAPSLKKSDVPEHIEPEERPFVDQLVKVFGSDRGVDFADHVAVAQDHKYGPKLVGERWRFLERKSFRRFFRDSLTDEDIDVVDEDIRDGVEHRYHSMEKSPLHDRLTKTMEQAAVVEVSGPLGKHRRVSVRVKQGVCHHFANVGEMPWA